MFTHTIPGPAPGAGVALVDGTVACFVATGVPSGVLVGLLDLNQERLAGVGETAAGAGDVAAVVAAVASVVLERVAGVGETAAEPGCGGGCRSSTPFSGTFAGVGDSIAEIGGGVAGAVSFSWNV